ncbi:hypothetical protein EUGRSUZ_G03156 [Eucalyptus grandis]|uniref:Uncharacterized protein n=1 Tax=Eucalyptus grandis TaxID=71139 RepID=A0ACC3K8N7_EUCGR|nr:hypothetical protein EUGRSUZ_G03156 [Eucalyptus grandis]
MGRYCSRVFTLVTLLLVLDNSGVEQEREALLQLRRSLVDPSGLLSSWEGRECCRWEGVNCDRVYGHVINLQLLPQPTKDETSTYSHMGSKLLLACGELNSSLLRLRYLNHLDLSGIDSNHGRIPEFIGSMEELRYLNLSFANFYGMVPQQLGNLTELEVLDLHNEYENLVVDDIPWVSHLQSLKYLDMSGARIVNKRVLMQVISMLPALSHLSLSGCRLHNFHMSSNHLANFTSLVHLQYLDLSSNHFEGPIPSTLFQNMTSLQHLDLSYNSFNLSIPMWFDKFTSLAHLNLEENDIGIMYQVHTLYLNDNLLGGILPSSLCDMELFNLNLANNSLSGSIPDCWKGSLSFLTLSFNKLSGVIPRSLGSLPHLTTLHLNGNHLNGELPQALDYCTDLVILDLGENDLSGRYKRIGLSAIGYLDLSSNHFKGKLGVLQELFLYNNHLEGVITEIHFSNLSRLKDLEIGDNNNLSFKAKPNWIPPFQLLYIGMNSCKFGAKVPRWIQTQVNAIDIRLSNASLFGPLPNWLANLTFSQLDLSYNQITLPKWSANLMFFKLDLSYNQITNLKFSVLYLSYNQITGPLPNMFINCSHLYLSHNLISGSLPTDIGIMYQVHTLYLNDNLLGGILPSSLCDMELFNLNLANNSLSGSIPDCWKGSLSFLTLSFNKLSGVIPSSLGSLPHLTTLHLNGNHLNGELPRALDYCTDLVILDLGENDLSGSILTWFDESFQSLSILRVRENRFVGNIPPQLCSLSRLKILDMAVNNLTRMIPHCLGNMSGMINLNQTNLFGSVAIAPIQDMNSLSFEADINWGQEHVVEIMKGRYNEYTKIVLRLVVNLDLSSNFLNGSIPEELSFLSKLHGLNLSHNHLSGNIPIGIGNMTSLESLDLSNNHLSRTIPQGISTLTSLAHLNLSQNDLMGQIPKGNQIQTLDDPSIYAGNPLLCGDLLRNKCLSAETPQPQKIPHPEDTHEEDKLDRTLFYAIVMLGFAIGFWGFFSVLQFKKDWRRAYFSFADQAAHKVYVVVVVKVAKLKRLRLSRSM